MQSFLGIVSSYLFNGKREVHPVYADYLKVDLQLREFLSVVVSLAHWSVSTNLGCLLAFDGTLILHFAQIRLISCLAEGEFH
jgi:hypothetical protein